MNLYKSGYVSVDDAQVRIIDSNERLAERLGMLQGMDDSYQDAAQPFEMPELSEASYEDAAVAALFSEEGTDVSAAPAPDLQEAEGAAGGDETLMRARAQAEEILENARRQAQELLEEAAGQAEAAAQHAYEEASLRGQQEGYQAGLVQVQQELADREQELAQLETELRQKYDDMQSEMEPYLVRELSGIYEHLIGVELSQYKNVLMYLIEQTLHNTEASQSYLIHVSGHDFSYVSMQKAQLVADGGLGNATLDVIEDQTLSKNQCLIETDNGIFDCSLSVQLEELKRKLMLLAYGGNGEKQQT